MNSDRVRVLKEGKAGPGPVVYWMSRDQRVDDNWALWHACCLAVAHKRPMVVVFCLVPRFSGAAWRQYAFMLTGLQEAAQRLEGRGIGFVLLQGDPQDQISAFVRKVRAAALVTDFDPLRIKHRWKSAVAGQITIPFDEVDAHNIVPCWRASPKQEFGAYTLRPKIHRLLPAYLEDFPVMKKHPYPWTGSRSGFDADRILAGLEVDRRVGVAEWIIPGAQAAKQALRRFIKERLEGYSLRRNDPVQDGQSGLSPYFHFGQLAPQRAALAVARSSAPEQDKDAFLEELIIRRELADNFCFYQPRYDGPGCAPAWAGATLTLHARDPREFIYTRAQFEKARTHDALWNASQMEMVRSGKMHGYMRMYWAKKILEWTPSVEAAWKIAIYLNDKYELDGRDPNGYAGIAWALGGVHDRAWGERRVFGKIRYMNERGCRSKFDVAEYIARNSPSKDGA